MSFCFLFVRACRELLQILLEQRGEISIPALAARTSIAPDDIVSTLQSLNLIKYWRGHKVICMTPKLIQEHLSTKMYRLAAFTAHPAILRPYPDFLTCEP